MRSVTCLRLASITTAAVIASGLLLLSPHGHAEAAPAPTITSLTPATGASAGGTAVTVTGTGFAAGATVTIGGVAATGITVTSTTSITLVTPAGTPGIANVTVRNTDNQAANLGGGFSYMHPAPTLTSIAPATGTSAGGTAVTLTGTGFRAGATVMLGGVAQASSVAVVNSTTITAVTPAGLVGASAVTIANTDGQSATLAGGFTYTAASSPDVNNVAPASGSVSGGTAITITGTGFVGGATVTVGGTAATNITVVNSTTITATTPAHASGAVAVAVRNPDTQSGTLTAAFTYNPLAAPTVTSVSPTTGPASGGTLITITGTGFVTGASVTVANVAATSVVVASATSITAIAPQRTVGGGSIVVTNVDGQSGTLVGAFNATANAAPTVSTISPSTGTTSGGTPISITGSGFLPNAIVSLGGSGATNVTVVSPTVITATTSTGFAGVVAVTVTNYDGLSGTNATGYTYKANAAPTISGAAPATGPLGGGTAVTITGTNFQSGASVRFGNNYAASVTPAGTTAILAVTPANVAGIAPIVVTNPDGQAAVLSTGFTYSANPAPTITSISPASGHNFGGTVVTITGSGFVTGATVMFGAFTATNPVINPTSIAVTTPMNLIGKSSVIVTNPDGQVAMLGDAFTYESTVGAGGTPNIATVPPAGGMTFVLAGTSDLQALMAAQSFKVVAAFALDVEAQIWRIYVVGAPQNSLTTIKATDIVVLRR